MIAETAPTVALTEALLSQGVWEGGGYAMGTE